MPDGFGELVRRHRMAAGLTQEELADRSGLGVRTISNLERGRTIRPHRSTLELLSRSLNLTGLASDELAAAYLACFGVTGGIAGLRPHSSWYPAHAGSALTGSVLAPQLPAATRHFVGRSAELSALEGLASLLDARHSPAMIGVIAGTAGVGKTALAVHWAHQAAARFPDGQLYIDLRGFDASGAPVSPAEAIRELLDTLQAGPARIPASLDALTGRYRSQLAGKRLLIILDNARDVAQVRPLLPGSADCLVLVTSRYQLTSLVAAHDADPLTVDVLTEAEGRELLERRLGRERVAAEPAAVTELIQMCARLPAALAIVAARAAVEPARLLTTLADELRDVRARLGALEIGDVTTSLRSMFSWSYRELSDPAARMFRLLGIHPGPDISVPAAASLAGVHPDQALEMLRELTRASLLAERAGDRFAFHDLIRAYAAEQAGSTDSRADRRTALHRALDHYLHAAWAAGRQLQPVQSPAPLPRPRSGVIREDFDSYSAAASWFQAEYHVLVAAITAATSTGLHGHARQIPSALRALVDRQGIPGRSSQCAAGQPSLCLP
jgi:transcriptional regulator with XRE-family HTH domain